MWSLPSRAGAIIAGTLPVFAAAAQWTEVPGARWQALPTPATHRPGFQPVDPATTGVSFTNFVPASRHLTNQILLNGSGVTAGDVDGDGRCDVFFAGMGGGSRLFRNLNDWKFSDVTRESGLDFTGIDATGTALADLDGDGDLDLVVSTYFSGTHLWYNDGKGRFARRGNDPALNQYRGAGSVALADFDGDGRLDLYVVNYRIRTIRDEPGTRFSVKLINGEPTVTSINGRPMSHPDNVDRFQFRFIRKGDNSASILHDEQGEVDAFYRNTPGGFQPVSFTGGVFRNERGQPLDKPPFDWGLAVTFRDFNGDGWPDLYVCNDFTTPDRIWINDRRGHFQALPTEAIRHTSLSSMGVDVADLNRDGHDDLFVLDMLSREHWRRLVQRTEVNPNMHLFHDVSSRPQIARNTLHVARGDGTFAELAMLGGLDAAEWAWTPIFLDVDLDGYEDLLVSNGFERDNLNMDVLKQMSEMRGGTAGATNVNQLALRREFPRLVTPNCAFRNAGNLTFTDESTAWGFDQTGVSQGMCLADLDNDGDLDVLVNNFNGPAFFLRNQSPAPRIAVRLRGAAANTAGIGAKVTLRGGAVPVQSQEMMVGGRYLSSDQAMRVFAPGTARDGLVLEVTWRNGNRATISNVAPNRLYEVIEGSDPSAPRPAQSAAPPPWLTDVSARLSHRHEASSFDDFDRQPLLPERLGELGPGVSWIDLDGDSVEELLIAGGNGSQPAAFRSDGRGGFNRLRGPVFDRELTRGQTTLLAWPRGDGRTAVIAGSSNYEDGLAEGGSARLYDLATQTVADLIPGGPAATGPLAMADLDGDGTLELLIGGRCLPGRWPESASSRLYRQNDGKFALDEANTTVLAGVGLISGAVFTDLTGDGAPDLALAGEWGAIRLFRNDRGRLVPWDPALELSQVPNVKTLSGLTGLWTGITAGDFDGDGRLDLAVGNRGGNNRFERGIARPLRLAYGDYNGDGQVGFIEAYFDKEAGDYVPWLDLETLGRGLPFLKERFNNYGTFSRATMPAILGDRRGVTREREASWLLSTVFLNRGDRFVATALPFEAQVAPVFGVAVADLDGDGREDLLLSQNQFGTRRDLPRMDAGRGLWLRGDGKGAFSAVPGQESGLIAYGEQRGLAVADYDGDGRVDVALAQVRGETKLFRNERGQPGRRIRLQGPVGNPQAMGAVLRLGNGPARELHAGGGYWSQDAATTVLAGNSPQLSIQWPDGARSVVNLPAEPRAVLVKADGTVAPLPRKSTEAAP